MKNENSLLNKVMGLWERTRRFHPALWILPHAAIIALALFLRPVVVDANLYSILPATSDSRMVSEAERKMSSANNSGMFILVGHRDFAAAREAAIRLAAVVADYPRAESVVCKIDAGMYEALGDFAFENRYRLQDDETVEAIRRDGGREYAERALATVYAPFSLSPLDRLAEDPFLLGESALRSYIESVLKNGTALSVRDDVLTSERDGTHYVLVSVRERSDAGSLETEANLVSAVYAAEERIRSQTDGIAFSNSGVPFHSYESASSAQREITIITAASMGISILILLLVFHSALPLACTIFAILLGSAFAFAATLLCFGEIHLFTIIFGTSLIGVSIDYAIHFFVARADETSCREGSVVLRRVLAGVWLGLVTTLISYGVLLIAPFPLLRQMALFSVAGLVSVFSTVVFALPATVARFGVRRPLPTALPRLLRRGTSALVALSGRKKIVLAVCVVAIAIPGLVRLRFDNDIRGLYTMSPALLESEKLAAKVLDHGSSGWYFIVEGSDEEDLLLREERLTRALDGEIGSGRLGSYLCTSRYLPSRSRQAETRKAIADNLLPLAGGQLELLGFGPAETERLKSDFRAREGDYLTADEYLSTPIGKMTGSFWIGEVGGKRYSAVLPLHAKDADFFESLAAGTRGVYFINKTADISEALGRISLSRLGFLLVAYAAIVLVLSLRYRPVMALKISRGPVAAGVLTCALLGYAGFPLNLFSVMGLVLIVGIGVDYSIFLTEDTGKGDATLLAVLLSALTTVFSFGTLSLSSFNPISTFGFTLLCGIVLSFVIAPINTAHIRDSHERRRADT